MKMTEAKKLQNRDEVVLKKAFDGKERVLQICGNSKPINKNTLLFDLFDGEGMLFNVSHKFLK